MRGPSQQHPPAMSTPAILPQYPQHPPYAQPLEYSHSHEEMVDRPSGSMTLGGRQLGGPEQHLDDRFYQPGPGDPMVDAHYQANPPPHVHLMSNEEYPPPPKKKSRRLTAPGSPSLAARNAPPPQQQPPSPQRALSNSTNKSHNANGSSAPAVLVREKKQKACANCRRAKLKCMVDKGQTECVRCKARKEKCVFYPRSHDEDWQQTLTADVYTAVHHLSNLSNVVHHILHHLTLHGIVPPLPGPPLEYYDAPDRDMGFLQGWGAEKNRDLGDKRKRGEEDDHHGQRRPTISDGGFQGVPTMDGVPSQWTPNHHTAPLPAPPGFDQLQMRPQLPPSSSSGHSHRPTLPEVLPPLRSYQQDFVQLTPTSELDLLSSHGPPSGQHYIGSSLPAPLASANGVNMPPPPPPDHPIRLPSPIAHQNSTPASLSSPSPAVAQATEAWTADQRNAASDPMPLRNSIIGVGEGRTFANDVPDRSERQAEASDEEDGEEMYGSDDVRGTVITKNIIPAHEARVLVDYFHTFISPHLFGYHLQIRCFPYLPEGPKAMTPFILAVECLLASERIPEIYPYHDALADQVLKMLLTSPAESWLTLEHARDSPEQVLGQAFGEDIWDPELGIGPEEIVAACALSTFIGQREQAKHIADYAFMWARGWANYLKDLKDTSAATIVEVTGMVPPLRRPGEKDIVRIWLLSYVVAGQEACLLPEPSPEALHDPSRWCRILIPEDTTAAAGHLMDPYDVLLVFHARLLALVRTWQQSRLEIHRPPSGINDPKLVTSSAHKRLASRTNANLDWLQEDLKGYGLDAVLTRQIQLDWLNAKVMVNSIAGKNLYGGPGEENLRRASRSLAVDSALQLLQKAASWDPPEALTNLPHAYLRMITLAASEVVGALTEVAQGSLDSSACPTPIEEVTPVLLEVSRMLFLGGLPSLHDCRTVGRTLRQHADNLIALQRFSPR